MKARTVPKDFPRDAVLGAVSGAYPKLLVRRIGDKYLAGPSEQLLHSRLDSCEDMAGQLVGYVQRKQLENPLWTLDEALAKVQDAMRVKAQSGAWDFTPAEIAWMMKRVHAVLVAPGAPSSNAGQSLDVGLEPGTANTNHVVGPFSNVPTQPKVPSVVDAALGRRPR